MICLARATSRSEHLIILVMLAAVYLKTGAARADGSSWSDALGPSGSVRLAYWQRDKSYDDKRGYEAGSAWLSLKPEELAGWKSYADGYLQSSNLGRQQSGSGDLREGYVQKSIGNLDLRIGRQIIVWGRADKVNPTDNLSTRNYTLLMTDDEDQRLGLFATQLTYNFGNVRVMAVWQPEWRTPTYPVAPIAGVSLSTARPEHPERQGAIKIDDAGGAVDWSLSYFDGMDRTPNLKLISAGREGVSVGLHYDRIRVAGGDLAAALGPVGLRAEAAYTWTDDQDGSNPLVKNANFYGVFGGDYSVIENLNLNVQLLYRHVFQFHSPADVSNPNLARLATFEAINTQQRFKDQTGTAVRPSYKAFNETLELEVAHVRWFQDGSSLTRPKVTYAVTDHLKVTGGAEIFRGPNESFFGREQDLSSGFGEVRWLY